MLIVCPSCTSRYNIDDAKIGAGGRKVRCAACATQWHVSLADAEPASEPAPASPPVPAPVPAPVPIIAATPTPEPEADPFDEEAMAREWARAEAWVDETAETGGLTADRIRAVDAGESLPDVPPAGAADEDRLGLSKAASAAALGAAAAAARVPWWRRLLARLFARKPKRPPQPAPAAKPAVAAPAPPITEAIEAGREALPDAPAPADAGATAPEPATEGGVAESETTPAVTPAAKPAPASRPAPRKAKAAKTRRPMRLPNIPLGPIAAGVAGFALLGGLYWQREALVRLVPAAAPAFQAAGVPVNLTGLAFSDIRSTIHREAEGRFLVVEGVIRSQAQSQVPVPQIELNIRGEDGRTVYSWTAEPPRRSLRPGESLHFRTRLATPPEAARDVEVRFSDKGQSASARP